MDIIRALAGFNDLWEYRPWSVHIVYSSIFGLLPVEEKCWFVVSSPPSFPLWMGRPELISLATDPGVLFPRELLAR